MIDPFDIRSAKRARLSLPWEVGFAGKVLSRNFASGRDLPNLTSDAFWDPGFVRAAIVTSEEQVEESSGSKDKVVVGGRQVLVGPAFLAVARKRQQVPWTEKVAEERQVAMNRWRLLISENPEGSRLGVQLCEAAQMEAGQDRVENILNDTFAGKSTRTLEQRSGSLLLFARWRMALPLFRGILPFKEPDVYDYLTFLRIAKAPATRGVRFRESVCFAFGVIGAHGAEEVMNSKRCQGAAVRSLETKKQYSQRDPLTAFQLQTLEECVFHCDNEADKIMSGNFAAMVHVRGRHSDVHHCSEEPILDDAGAGTSYFQVGVMETKVTRKDKKRRCLPLVGHACGLTGKPWAKEWLRLRKAHGLNAAGGPLMNAIKVGGQWSDARLRSQEAATWIAEILRRHGAPILPGQKFGTHSAKSTLLSWCAKAGVRLDVRNILGYHSAGAAESSLLYARDALAGPLRALERVLVHVREGRFHPDDTRSGRWDITAPVADRKDGRTGSSPIPGIDYDAISNVSVSDDGIGPRSPVVETDMGTGSGNVERDEGTTAKETVVSKVTCNSCWVEHCDARTIWTCDECSQDGCSTCLPLSVVLGRLICDACNLAFLNDKAPVPCLSPSSPASSSDSSSESEEESNSEAEGEAVEMATEVVAESVLGRQPAKNPDDFVVQHRVTKMLHMLRRTGDDSKALTCGRIVTEKFRVFHFVPTFAWPKCKICFGTLKEA